MAKSAAQMLMERETRVSYGRAPHALFGEVLAETGWQLRGDSFLLRGQGDHYFFYRVGHGVVIERGAAVDLSEERLWLYGSVYAAVASINGLLPIHASAVAYEGRVFAFTGPAGAGKSTLVAALGARGMPMFCDDTLVLDLSEPDRVICLPGHKRLKLCPDAVDLTGATPQERVSLTVDKFYALPPAGEIHDVLPLEKLIFLERGSEPRINPLSASDRFRCIQDDHQTSHLFAAARRFSRGEQFEHFGRLAKQIRMARFLRPMDKARFDEGVALAEQYVTHGASHVNN